MVAITPGPSINTHVGCCTNVFTGCCRTNAGRKAFLSSIKAFWTFTCKSWKLFLLAGKLLCSAVPTSAHHSVFRKNKESSRTCKVSSSGLMENYLYTLCIIYVFRLYMMILGMLLLVTQSKLKTSSFNVFFTRYGLVHHVVHTSLYFVWRKSMKVWANPLAKPTLF